MKSRGSQCNETLLVRTAVRPGKKLGSSVGGTIQNVVVIVIIGEMVNMGVSASLKHTHTVCGGCVNHCQTIN